MEPGLSGWDLEPEGDWGELEVEVRWEETDQVPDREENVSVLPVEPLSPIRLVCHAFWLIVRNVEPKW
jgi:hypothetical protein